MSEFDPIAEYSAGLVGCMKDPRADEEFEDYILRHGGDPEGSSVAYEWEFAGAGDGKLTLLFPQVFEIFPNCLPGTAQVRGDCVAKAAANTLLCSLGMEIYSGKPDEVTGKVEGPPDIPKAGVEDNVVASESLWAWRGYDRDGWTCSRAAKVACQEGFLVRKPYPELGFDLTNYTKTTTRLGGSKPPGSKWLEESQKHKARTATNLKGREQVRDFLHAGYGVLNCSSLGFSSARDEFGFSKQTGSWAHAQTFWGYDDRPETKERYGQSLVLWCNQWGAWNRGGTRIAGTSIDIPPGCFWALASTIDRCSCIALSSVAGWPRRKMPDYGAAGRI